jgi:hypothetical protein
MSKMRLKEASMLCYLEVDTFQFFRTSPTNNVDKQIEIAHSGQSFVKEMSL